MFVRAAVSLVFLLAAACAAAPVAPESSLEAGREAWRDGRAAEAQDVAAAHMAYFETDEARALFVTAAAARGDYDAAFAAYDDIAPDFDGLGDLDGVVFDAYLHADRAEEAAAFAERRGLPESKAAAARVRAERPFAVEIDGVRTIAFHQDPLTAAMPGFAITMNGVEHVGRLDTGGAFAHLSPSMAEELGVVADACSEGFAVLQPTKVCRGVADMTIGAVTFTNTPVAVIDALPSGEMFGGRLGPVIGTNVLQRFLATVDPIGGKMLLSDRGDAAARRDHLGRLGPEVARVPFLLVGDHYIVARGTAGGAPVNFFIDTGLLAFDSNGDQAALLGPQSVAAAWEGRDLAAGGVEILNTPIALGGAAVDGASMLVLPDPAWAAFGDFGGMRVDALLSNGFFKKFVWTLDFDAREILLTAPAP